MKRPPEQRLATLDELDIGTKVRGQADWSCKEPMVVDSFADGDYVGVTDQHGNRLIFRAGDLVILEGES